MATPRGQRQLCSAAAECCWPSDELGVPELMVRGYGSPEPRRSPVAFDMGKVVTDALENSWWITRHCARNRHSRASTVLQPATAPALAT
jgi:hypothetical protein